MRGALGCFGLFAMLITLGALPVRAQSPINERAVEAAKGVDTWICNTPGGYVYDAILIGEELQRRQAGTLVPRGSVCASAGALAWLAGTRRQSRGRLLFHGISPRPTWRQRVALFTVLEKWGTPQDLALRIVTLEPDDLWEPSGTDLVALLR